MSSAIQVISILCARLLTRFTFLRRLSGRYCAPMNARGLYTNFWYHYGWSWYDDFTENAVLFLMTAGDVTAPGKAANATTLKTTMHKDADPSKS